MQNAAIEKISARNAEYKGSKYFAFEVDPANLKDALEKFRHKGFKGINLTIPHKEVVMGILGDLDAAAKNAGACNTLLRTESGWKGFNTDGLGLEKAVEKNFGRGFENAEVVLIGAGGIESAAVTGYPVAPGFTVIESQTGSHLHGDISERHNLPILFHKHIPSRCISFPTRYRWQP